ncbi:hypothetical protein N7V09_14225 [Shewanella seohaensis]|uniref:hypothetical protein n=1 Tax=Shewanella seohaensis TaxID=755175 RepID=UPI00200DC28A|nr:hypothetical protein [Shewanella seohaensis]MCL1122014.1 hypothetical protein [Shewanella seohaensis]UXM81004.1 hypothetical protein N7V09_14225 [Shewanella seohaensis]
MKKFSKLLREIQYQEVFYLINSSDLSPPEKQSLRDRLKAPLNHIDAYYVRRIEKGSILIESALTASALWLLVNTLGESIKEAWKLSEFHHRLVDYLSKPKVRRVVIDRCFDRVFEAWNFDGFIIDEIEKKDDGEDLIVKVKLKTEHNLQIHIDQNLQEQNIELLLKKLEEEIRTSNYKGN